MDGVSTISTAHTLNGVLIIPVGTTRKRILSARQPEPKDTDAAPTGRRPISAGWHPDIFRIILRRKVAATAFAYT